MLHLFLVDTALELVPPALHTEKAYQSNVNKFGNAGKVLDTTYHHSIMRELPRADARGRPDILHHFLLDALGSPANQKGHLRVYFHTPEGLFTVHSEMQCPRDYIRFKALMAQLLEAGTIPVDPPHLIEKVTTDFPTWIHEKFENKPIWGFSRHGTTMTFAELCQITEWHQRDIAVFVGGFQKGTFSPPLAKLVQKWIALGPQGWDSWVVITRILSAFEYGMP